MRYLVKVSYNGTSYNGWQKQKNKISLQETIENCFSTYLKQEIDIVASGRTDKGVHAIEQCFHFDFSSSIKNVKNLAYHINCMLPDDIEIKSVRKVKNDFHARFSSKEKHYLYKIYLKDKEPFLNDYVWFYPFPFDYELAKQASKLFIGNHCFQNFTSKEEDDKNFVRNIYSIDFIKKNNLLKIRFKGDGFMRYQIRFIVGCIMAVANKKESLDFINDRLTNLKERKIVKYKAPSCGLFLEKVIY